MSEAPWRIYNIGNGNPVKLRTFLEILEKEIGIKAKYKFVELQKGDVLGTFSDNSSLKHDMNFCPDTKFEDGVKLFVQWYKQFYGLN